MQYDLIRLTQHSVEKHGRGRGGFVELTVHQNGSNYFIGDEALPQIVSFDNLEGIVPSQKRKPVSA
jgi:hypothetical protein